ncbi:MAG: LysR family transcriptional regulator [Bacteriovorax sp.]|nr:LysR family transcriptional regulator [Bacteriovorax sp.]
MYNYNHLYYFYVTAKAGGVTSASTHLRISQPSLSSQLKVLEQSLDLKLFQKAGRTIELTNSGTEVFGYCRQMFEFSEKMSEQISKRVPTSTRKICIGVSEHVDRSFVADIVSLFLKKYDFEKRPKVTVVSATQAQLLEKLRFKEFDAVVSDAGMIDSNFVDLEKAEFPVVLTGSSKWKAPTAVGSSDDSSVFQQILEDDGVQWIMPSPKFKFRGEIDKFFETNKAKKKIAFESDLMGSLVHAVTDEIGLAFFPLLYVNQFIRDNVLQAIGPKEGYWKYNVSLTCHSQNKDDQLVQQFSNSFKEICTKEAVLS